jgi:DNA-binding MarR family transcriptional regulator
MKRIKKILIDEIYDFNQQIRKKIEHNLKKEMISWHQLKVLKLLKNKPLTQKEIAFGTHSDEPSTTRTLDRLIKKSFIEKVNSLEDRRKNYISLTAKGKRVLNKLLKVIAINNKEVENHITDEELEIMLMLLNKLTQKGDI